MPKRAGRKSKAQTPAPRKERIYGSKKNPKGSAASEKSASKIKLDDKTMTALKNKLKEFKEKHPNKKNITLNDLKAVYRRGAGAYSKSHRPTITGGAPNTRNAWSMARVNKFLLKAGGAKVKAAYVQDDDLMKMRDGGEIKLLAPNGRNSNLTIEQWFLVRTPEFKAWFGDWENDPHNASKVVDENGEPLVVYRSISPKPLAQGYNPTSGSWDYTREGYQYFAKNKDYARVHGYLTKEFFLNIRNILDFNYYNEILIENGITSYYNNEGIFQISNELEEDKPYIAQVIKVMNNMPELGQEIKNKLKTADGFHGYEAGFYGEQESYVVLEPQQIKLADGTNTTFDPDLPDSRFAIGGSIDEIITCKNCGWSWNESQTTPSEKYICHKCGFDNEPNDDYAKGGQTFNDKELLAKWKRGESIGFTATAHLKAKGLIPRSDGTKRKSPQYKKQGGLIGGFEDLTDEWLSKKIEIFLNKVKPIKFYFVDPNTNTLTIGFDKYYSQDAAQKVYEEATSSKEFFHAPSVESTYDSKTGDLVFKIKLKKAVEYSKGGKIVYSAIFFDEDEIVKRYGQVHPNLYSHHSTIEFKPQSIGDLPIGDRVKISIVGRLTTNKVDVLLVNNPFSKNKHPHITLSTSEDVKPFESNKEIEQNIDKVEPLNDYLKGVIGYFDGSGDITKYDEGGEVDDYGYYDDNYHDYDPPTYNLVNKIHEGEIKLNDNERYILSDEKKISLIEQKQVQYISNTRNSNWHLKPKGLWYSIGDAWADYVYFSYPEKYNEYCCLHKIEVTNKVLKLDTIEKCYQFTDKYGFTINNPYFVNDPNIAWDRVALDYSGIEISNPHEWSTVGESRKLFWMYGWDVPSGCIWKEDGIKSIKLLYSEGDDAIDENKFAKGGEVDEELSVYLQNIRPDPLYGEGWYKANFGRNGGITWEIPESQRELESPKYLIVQSMDRNKDVGVANKEDSKGEGAKAIASLFLKYSNLKEILYDDYSEGFWQKIGGTGDVLKREDFFKYFNQKNKTNYFNKGGKLNQYFRAEVGDDFQKQKTFIPNGYYEMVGKDGNPVIKYDEYAVSNVPEVAASKTIYGAILGASSMLKFGKGITKNTPIQIYTIQEKPDVDISHWGGADFEYLDEVRYRKNVLGKYLLEYRLDDDAYKLVKDFYDYKAFESQSKYDDQLEFDDSLDYIYEMISDGTFFQKFKKLIDKSLYKKTYLKGGEVDEQIIKERWAKKKDSLMNMADNIRSLRTNLRKDLKGDDDKDRLTALAISIMDKTAERVGNDESEANGHLGITGLSKRNVKVEGNTITLKYIGKSGVKHEKQFSDEGIATALKDAIANSQSKYVFETSDGFRIKNDRINRYLSEYDISAKDLRGYSANQWIVSKLREVSDKEILGDEAKRKKKFNEIVKSVAEKVGHGAPTLKKHYMLPSLEREWVNNGKIVDLSNIKRAFEDGGVINYARGGSPRIRMSEANEIKEYIKKQHEQGKSASWGGGNRGYQYVARPDGVFLSYDIVRNKYKFFHDIDSFVRALYRLQVRGYKKGGDVGVSNINQGTSVINNIDYDHLDESQDIPNDGEGVFDKGGALDLGEAKRLYSIAYGGYDGERLSQSQKRSQSMKSHYAQRKLKKLIGFDIGDLPSHTHEQKKIREQIINSGEMKKGGELKFNDIVLYHEKNGNWFVPKNTVYAWLYQDPNAAKKLENGEFDFVLFPPNPPMSLAMQRGYVPPLLKIWTKKYQKETKGADNLLGIVKAWYDEKNQKLYIIMMTTRKDMRRKGVNSHIIKNLREEFKLDKDQIIFDKPTKEGEMFSKSGKYSHGGEVDLFEHYDELPKKVQAILEKYENEEPDYTTLESLQGELEEQGYTFDYGLDYEPYGLRKMEKGGELVSYPKRVVEFFDRENKKWVIEPFTIKKGQLIIYNHSDGGDVEAKFLGKSGDKAKIEILDSYSPWTRRVEIRGYVNPAGRTEPDYYLNQVPRGTKKTVSVNLIEIADDKYYSYWQKPISRWLRSPEFKEAFGHLDNPTTMAKGGEINDEDKKETYKKWKSLVNMSKSELEKFYNSEEGKVAGLTASQAKSQGIDSGRESARWIMKMKDTSVKNWTPTMWKWAKKQISFISRMSGNKGKLYDDSGAKTRKHTSLLIWGHNPTKKAGGGELDIPIKENAMNEVTYNQLPAINDLGVGKKFVLKEHYYNNHNGKPTHQGCRYLIVENMGDAQMSDCLKLKVHQCYGGGGVTTMGIITRPIKNIMNKGRDMGESLASGVEKAFKKGGELDPDKKEVKEYFEHKSGAAGGLLVGKRHSEGGIQAINKSTGQPLEMEGGEVVITRDAVSDSTLHDFNGKQMTNREILSAINESGGGVKFAEGGDVSCKCSGKEYKLGGKTYKDYELFKKINNSYGSKSAIEMGMKVEDKEHGETFKMLKNGEITYEQFLKKLVVDHLSENPKYYDK